MQLYRYILFLLFASAPAAAQVSVTLDTDTRSVKVNERFLVTIVLNMDGPDLEMERPLMLPDFSKFEILGNASERSDIIDRDTRRRQMIYQLILAPKQAGKLKIGSALVQVNGNVYKSEPFDITVKAAERQERQTVASVSMDLEVHDRRIFENEATIAVLRAYSRDLSHLRSVTLSDVPHQNNARIYKISDAGKEVEQREAPDGSLLASQVVATFMIFPIHPGVVEIPAMRAEVAVRNGNAVISSEPVKLHVKKLPVAPDAFKNAVGQFNISLKPVSESKTETGKPVKIKMELTGTGNFKDVKLPKILPSKDYSVFSPTVKTQIKPGSKGFSGNITAEYVIVPKTEGEIPIRVEQLAYFNPKNQEYSVAAPAKLFLNVLSQEAVEASGSTVGRLLQTTGTVLQDVSRLRRDEPNLRSDNEQTAKPRDGVPTLVVLFALAFAGFFGWVIHKLFTGDSRRPISATVESAPQDYFPGDDDVTSATEQQPESVLPQPDIGTRLSWLAGLLNERKYGEFFDTYLELRHDVENGSRSNFLKDVTEQQGAKAAEAYRTLQSRIELMRFMPVQTDEEMAELMAEIKQVFSDIDK